MCPGNILNLTEPLLKTTSKYYKLHLLEGIDSQMQGS